MEDANGAANGLEVNEEKDKQPYDATACLYKLGCDKAFHKWNFMFMFDDENLMSLANFKRYLIKNHGLEEVARRFGIATSVFSITVHRTKKEPLFPNGRIFTCNTQDEWLIYRDFVRKDREKHELIGKFVFFSILVTFLRI